MLVEAPPVKLGVVEAGVNSPVASEKIRKLLGVDQVEAGSITCHTKCGNGAIKRVKRNVVFRLSFFGLTSQLYLACLKVYADRRLRRTS